MSEYFRWIEHKGKRVLLITFTGIKEEKVYLQAIVDLERELLKQPKTQVFPMVLDVSDTYLTRAVTTRAKQMMDTLKAKGIPDSPTALVGLSRAQKAIILAIQVIRPDLRMSGSVEEAKDWVVKQLK